MMLEDKYYETVSIKKLCIYMKYCFLPEETWFPTKAFFFPPELISTEM